MKELGYELLQARFTDQEKKTIEGLWIDPENPNDVQSSIVEFDLEHPAMQEILEFVTIDDIHETTVNEIRAQQKQFEQAMLEVAKANGLITGFSVDAINADNKWLVKTLFSDYNSDSEEERENLFALKLELFELDSVSKSKNRELKAKIRKSKTPLEAVVATAQLIEEEHDGD